MTPDRVLAALVAGYIAAGLAIWATVAAVKRGGR